MLIRATGPRIRVPEVSRPGNLKIKIKIRIRIKTLVSCVGDQKAYGISFDMT